MDAAIPAILARRPAPVAVLASGDPHWFGVAATLARHVPHGGNHLHPRPLRLRPRLRPPGLGDAGLRHPLLLRPPPRPRSLRLLHPGARILALSADAATPAAVAALLAATASAASRLHLLEALGGPAERIRTATAAAFAVHDIHPLNLLAHRGRCRPRRPRPPAHPRPGRRPVRA